MWRNTLLGKLIRTEAKKVEGSARSRGNKAAGHSGHAGDDVDAVADAALTTSGPSDSRAPIESDGSGSAGLFAPSPPCDTVTRVVFDTHSVWRAGWVVVAVVALASLLKFVLSDASAVIFLLLMSFFMAIALEPAVSFLNKYMSRPLAAGVVLVSAIIFGAVFFGLFSTMLFEQMSQFIQSVPALIDAVIAWVNENFETKYESSTILQDLGLTQDKISEYGTTVAGGVAGILTSLFSALISLFAGSFFTYYLSANMPRLRAWIAGLFRPQHQIVFLTVWQLILTKVGGYVAARMILATINSTTTGIFLWMIDLPYWMPLALWTGIVAQFVPNVGTYISIALPMVVGFTSDDPTKGIYVLVFSIVYQQLENIFVEPRISARAVNVHPVVSFSAALGGAQLFGIAGAMLGVPVAATLMAALDLYKQRYDVSADTEEAVALAVQKTTNKNSQKTKTDNRQGAPGDDSAGNHPANSSRGGDTDGKGDSSHDGNTDDRHRTDSISAPTE